MADNVISGGCACGAVRYTTTVEPAFSFHCQCRQCQRSTGSGHASAFVVPRDAVAVTGSIRFYERISDAGNTVNQGFCAECGSPLMNKNSGYPDSVYFHAATLDDPSIFKPTTVLFSDAAQPWDYIDPNIR